MQGAILMPETHQVFVSFSRPDVATAGAVMASLEHAGTRVWTDSAIRPGEDFVEAIERGMSGSDVYLLIISPEFLISEFCIYELGFALKQQRSGAATIIPVVIGATDEALLPAYLRKFHVIDGRGLRAEQIVAKVLDRLRHPQEPVPRQFANA
jgi:hypothetical protein